eukprot:3954379-Pyramimonas_sp.AAC.1
MPCCTPRACSTSLLKAFMTRSGCLRTLWRRRRMPRTALPALPTLPGPPTVSFSSPDELARLP